MRAGAAASTPIGASARRPRRAAAAAARSSPSQRAAWPYLREGRRRAHNFFEEPLQAEHDDRPYCVNWDADSAEANGAAHALLHRCKPAKFAQARWQRQDQCVSELCGTSVVLPPRLRGDARLNLSVYATLALTALSWLESWESLQYAEHTRRVVVVAGRHYAEHSVPLLIANTTAESLSK